MNPVPAESCDLECDHVAVKWYAGFAMQAMIAKQGIPDSQPAREEIALWAFRMAQAMVAVGNQLVVANSSDQEC